jgi:hypothetical protein
MAKALAAVAQQRVFLSKVHLHSDSQATEFSQRVPFNTSGPCAMEIIKCGVRGMGFERVLVMQPTVQLQESIPSVMVNTLSTTTKSLNSKTPVSSLLYPAI